MIVHTWIIHKPHNVNLDAVSLWLAVHYCLCDLVRCTRRVAPQWTIACHSVWNLASCGNGRYAEHQLNSLRSSLYCRLAATVYKLKGVKYYVWVKCLGHSRGVKPPNPPLDPPLLFRALFGALFWDPVWGPVWHTFSARVCTTSVLALQHHPSAVFGRVAIRNNLSIVSNTIGILLVSKTKQNNK